MLQVNVTREIRVVIHHPDPNLFSTRPLGLPSGVRIAAITLERSPLQMRVTSPETANAFVAPQTPQFIVSLENITPQPQPYTLTLQASDIDGVSQKPVSQSGQVAAGQVAQGKNRPALEQARVFRSGGQSG